MRLFSLLITACLLNLAGGWGTDLEDAKKTAEKEHKLILLNFSGSDWCGPCIKMHDEIFESDAFKKLAENDLVLVNADFPRLHKNQLSKDQQKKNDKLADKYDPEGIFPMTVLLSSEGKLIKRWEGYPGLTADQFVTQVKGFCNARR